METPISIIDYATITFYFALVIALGIATSKGQSREGFLIADRNLKTVANSTSMVACKIGAGVIMTFVALVYLFGYSAIWYFVGASAGYIVFVFFAIMLKKYRTRKNSTSCLTTFFSNSASGLVSSRPQLF